MIDYDVFGDRQFTSRPIGFAGIRELVTFTIFNHNKQVDVTSSSDSPLRAGTKQVDLLWIKRLSQLLHR